MAFPAEVLIFGGGACAKRIGANLARQGTAVWMVPLKGRQETGNDQNNGFRILSNVQFIQCQGFAGNFNVALKQNGNTLVKKPGAIVVAQEEMRTPNFDAYGLTPTQRVCSLSHLEKSLGQTSADTILKKGDRVVFLNSWLQESHPAVSTRMLDLCLRLQKSADVLTYFLTGNLKVAANGLEAEFQEAKSAGTIFMKFSHQFPELKQLDDGVVQVDYWDEITRMPFSLRADIVVVDESIVPDESLSPLAAGLGIDRDKAGFLQSDNVHRLGNATNRRGIFVAGGARAIQSDDEQMEDADQVALKVIEFLYDLDQETLPKVEINTGRCARCLTCYRICPYKAITLDSSVRVVPQACQSCGTCAAACPGRAIDVQGDEIETQLQQMAQSAQKTVESQRFLPQLVAFCCARSAAKARKLALFMGHTLPEGMLFIDSICGGSISTYHLLSAFDAGADGVMLLTCHTDNCHSEKGNQHARKRADTVLQTLKMAGVETERLELSTLASNMGSEFARIIQKFENRIKEIGPLVQRGKI